MNEDYLSFYKFTVFVFVLAVVLSVAAVVYLEMGKREEGGGGAEEESGEGGETGFDVVRWAEGWLNYTGGYLLPPHTYPHPPVEGCEMDLTSHPERKGHVSEEGLRCVGGKSMGETSSTWISERLGAHLLFSPDKTFYFATDEYSWWGLGSGEKVGRGEIEGTPAFVDRIGNLSFLITADDPEGWEREAIVSGRELPDEGGLLYLINLRDGKVIFAERLPGLPVDAKLSPPYLYVLTAKLQPSSNTTEIRLHLYITNLSKPGRIDIKEAWGGGSEEYYWLDNGLLVKSAGKGRFYAYLSLEGGSATLKGIMNMTLSWGEIDSVDLNNGYLRVGVPGEGTLYFFRIPGSESSEVISPVVKGFRTPDIGFNIEHTYLFGDYAIISTYTNVGITITPRIFYAATPSSFTYVGEVPVVGEFLFRKGEYLIVVRSIYDTPALSLLWWSPPASPRVLDSRTLHPQGDLSPYDTVIDVYYSEPYLSYLLMSRDSHFALQLLLVDVNNETIGEEGALIFPEYTYPEYIYIKPSTPPIVVFGIHGWPVVSQLRGLEDYYFPLGGEYIPGSLCGTDQGYVVVGRYLRNDTITLRSYSRDFTLTGEVLLKKDANYYTIRLFPTPGADSLRLFLSVYSESNKEGSMYYFRIDTNPLQLSKRVRVGINGSYFTWDVAELDGEGFLIFTQKVGGYGTSTLYIFNVSSGNVTVLGNYTDISPGSLWYREGTTLYAVTPVHYNTYMDKLYSDLLSINLLNGSYKHFTGGFIPISLLNTTLVAYRCEGENFYIELMDIVNGSLIVASSLQLPSPPISALVVEGELYVLSGGMLTYSGYYTGYLWQPLVGAEQYLLHLSLRGGNLTLVESFTTSDAQKLLAVDGKVYLIYPDSIVRFEGVGGGNGVVMKSPGIIRGAISLDDVLLVLTDKGVYKISPAETTLRLL